MSVTKNFSPSMFIGRTTRGLSTPVFWDPHTSVFNNAPPVTFISGTPGAGKTYAGQTFATLSGIVGKTTLIIDPKGDFLYLKAIKELPKVYIWDVTSGEPGVLDPFSMAEEKSETITLALELIEIFCGGITSTQSRFLHPIVEDTANKLNPSLSILVQDLRSHHNEEVNQLGNTLNVIQNLEFANLCFASGRKAQKIKTIDDGVTIAALTGLSLPPADTPREDYTHQERLAAGLMLLITYFANKIINTDQPRPKTLVIDEAAFILPTKTGANLVKRAALLGRSKAVALILITQNTQHIASADIKNTISTHFAFRCRSRDEAAQIIKDMQLPEEEGFEELLLCLENGECLMKDWTGNYGAVKISADNEEWWEIFNTNPLDRIKKQNELAKN